MRRVRGGAGFEGRGADNNGCHARSGQSEFSKEIFQSHEIPWWCLVAGSAAETVEPPEEAKFGVLRADVGAEETFIYCTACHSEMIVAQQGLTCDSWLESLDWMIEELGMDEIEGSDLTLVIDNLEKNYGVDGRIFQRTDTSCYQNRVAVDQGQIPFCATR